MALQANPYTGFLAEMLEGVDADSSSHTLAGNTLNSSAHIILLCWNNFQTQATLTMLLNLLLYLPLPS